MAKKILIVEDEYDLVKLLKYSFEKEGFKVNSATDGSVALAEMRRDEPDLAESLESNLGRCNYEARATTSPDDGLKVIEKGEFDLLLSDLMMPGMNGIELLR